MLTAPDSNPILCSVTLVRARLANVSRVGIGLQIIIQITFHDVPSPPKSKGSRGWESKETAERERQTGVWECEECRLNTQTLWPIFTFFSPLLTGLCCWRLRSNCRRSAELSSSSLCFCYTFKINIIYKIIVISTINHPSKWIFTGALKMTDFIVARGLVCLIVACLLNKALLLLKEMTVLSKAFKVLLELICSQKWKKRGQLCRSEANVPIHSRNSLSVNYQLCLYY